MLSHNYLTKFIMIKSESVSRLIHFEFGAKIKRPCSCSGLDPELSLSLDRLKSSRKSSDEACKNTCLQVLRRALDLDVEFVEMDYEV